MPAVTNLPSPAGRPAIHALTAIRGIAAWWVVLYHVREFLPATTPAMLMAPLAQGYLAVDLFFILSGFVIALNYLADFRRISVHGIAHFLALRLGRIYPLHGMMLLAFLANPLAIGAFSANGVPGPRYAPDYFGLSLLLVQNWGFTGPIAWNIPAWSISTEWFAYIAFPAIAWATLRLARGPASAAGLLLGLVATLATVSAVIGGTLGDRIESFGLLRCVLEFSTGVMLERLHAYRLQLPRGAALLYLALATTCLGAYATLPIADWLVVPLGFAGLILALAQNAGGIERLLAGRMLLWLGEVSYATYLCHYFLKDWTKFLFIQDDMSGLPVLLGYVAAVLLASALLHRWVEVPGRRLSRDLIRQRLRAPRMTAPATSG